MAIWPLCEIICSICCKLQQNEFKCCQAKSRVGEQTQLHVYEWIEVSLTFAFLNQLCLDFQKYRPVINFRDLEESFGENFCHQFWQFSRKIKHWRILFRCQFKALGAWTIIRIKMQLTPLSLWIANQPRCFNCSTQLTTIHILKQAA